MKLTYHGHSVVSIETNDGTRLLIDPFVTGNALTDLEVANIDVDYILVTHGHGDHIGDTVEIAKKTNACVIAIPEIIHFVESQGVKSTHGMNIGGAFDFPFGRVKMVFAQHSSGFEGSGEMVYMGEPAGFLIESDDKVIYHAGDTAYFTDMSLYAEDKSIDVALLPIGDNFTMGPRDAVKAYKQLKATHVIPIHYNTFPVIQQNPQEFVALLPKDVGVALSVGESLDM